jgi:hypothetical protein
VDVGTTLLGVFGTAMLWALKEIFADDDSFRVAVNVQSIDDSEVLIQLCAGREGGLGGSRCR